MERIVQDVNQNLNALHVLEEKTEAMRDILKSIQDIHSQTHLLSLNAAIEAAHAKEYGRSFSVVAEEIRKLSKYSEDAVKDVNNHLESVNDQVGKIAEGTMLSKKVIEGSYEHIQQAVHGYVTIEQTASQLDVQARKLVSML
ncbi:Methyl-accepting chemotaxis protein 4 [compost metagenome]